jgi:DNA-binding PadR family transcriptional regulator
VDKPRLDHYLPLTPTVFDILLALADSEKHGYAILQTVNGASTSFVTLRAGTLYRALSRLLEQELVEELSRRPPPARDDERRRYYRITALGRRVLKSEVARLQQQLSGARTKKLLREGS